MKLVVVGFGQCGGKIADEFSRLNARARLHRRIHVLDDIFAVNTDTCDLSTLTNISSDYQHRILMGNRRTAGHGVGKLNEVGAEIAKKDADKVIEAVRSARGFYETDAFLLVASAAGGTGSGSMPIIAQTIKERFWGKPIYALVILPFDHEVKSCAKAFSNTATCLKAIYSVADAVFLVDNQRYIEKDSSLLNNMSAINKLIVDPFYDLLCAGEEKKAKRIGSKVLDAGDIFATARGWTSLGYGISQLPTFKLRWWKQRNFRNKGTEVHKGIGAMDQAISNLSFRCDPKDASTVLYLVSAPTQEMNMDLVKELVDYLAELAPQATIRYGDYPRGESTLKITLILSQLGRVDVVKNYYDKMPDLILERERRDLENEGNLRELANASIAVPSLFGGNGENKQ
ncbi:MAG: tubulin/FtsZ family protein [Chloroflexota bacterium]